MDGNKIEWKLTRENLKLIKFSQIELNHLIFHFIPHFTSLILPLSLVFFNILPSISYPIKLAVHLITTQ